MKLVTLIIGCLLIYCFVVLNVINFYGARGLDYQQDSLLFLLQGDRVKSDSFYALYKKDWEKRANTKKLILLKEK